MRERLETELRDRYAIERELGSGGMATVWLARDLRHDRPVALKVLHSDLAGALGVDRFVREVRLTARLQHPGIVSVLDSGVVKASDGTSLPWYVMPFVEGESLRARMQRENQLPIDDALHITQEVAQALQVAHQQGVVHRDIKPENIMLSHGRAYVVDFGIAKALIETGGERLTSTGLAIGTPTYMSPEQAMSGEVDPRTDQYALATVVYEMLAGEPPFAGSSVQAMVARRVAEPARPIRPLRSTVPESMERAVLRGLERAPADRYPTVEAFAAALKANEAPATRPRPVFSRRSLGALAAVLLVASIGLWRMVAARTDGRVKPRDPEVTALYQRGVRAYDRRTPGGVVEALSAFNAAVRHDSSYAGAWTGIAKTYVRAYERHFSIPGVSRDSMPTLAVSAVDGALAADPRSPDAWLTQGMVSRMIDPTDVNPAIRSIQRSIQLDSTAAPPRHFLALSLAEQGDFGAAMESWRQSVRLDPKYTQALAFLALAHYWRRQYDSAAVWADSAIALDPKYLLGWTTVGFIAVERGDLARGSSAFGAARRISTDVEVVNSLAGFALVEARAGRRGEALRLLKQADSLALSYIPVPLHTAVDLGQAYAALGDAGTATSWLGRYLPREDLHFQLHLRCDPPFDPVRNDQRFQSLLIALPTGKGC